MKDRAPEPEQESFDVVVIGSGAAGLSAAVTAAHHGARILVLEKASVVGGTTAWSGGWMWIPRNPLAVRGGIQEDAKTVKTYLRASLGDAYNADHIEAFLEAGPRMVSFFETNTALQFVDGNRIPDMHGGLAGAALGGRSVCAAPFDGRALGRSIRLLREPLAETAFFGMAIASGTDLSHFMAVSRSMRSAAYATRRFVRHLADRAVHGRGLYLVNGNALAARLLKSALDLGVDVRTEHRAYRLLQREGRIEGVAAMRPDGTEAIVHARRGVVLASGGFPQDPAFKRQFFAHAPTGVEHWSVAPHANTGDGLRMAMTAGGTLSDDVKQPGAWVPISLVPRRDGSYHPFPHFIDRAKPGLIAVLRNGCRFTNEADGYHDVLCHLLQNTPTGELAEAWLVCDHRFLRRYGLGHVRPAPVPYRRHLKIGYLKRAHTIGALAKQCGIDSLGLEQTVADYNRHASAGRDPLYRRGDIPFNRAGGDASVSPNPCVAPIQEAPFYAVRIVPGSMGTFKGIRTDAAARVLDSDSAPIAGLFAAGADMTSIMKGAYPAGGINLGPAMTFGHIVGLQLSRDYDEAGDRR